MNPDHRPVPAVPLTDTDALTAIAAILRRPDWNADTLDEIAAICEAAGRDLTG